MLMNSTNVEEASTMSEKPSSEYVQT